jgi:hypothetical protein
VRYRTKRTETAPNEKFGWWYSIEAGDFNKDGQEDLVLGNLGKTSKWKLYSIVIIS